MQSVFAHLQLADFGMSHDMGKDYYYKPKGGMIPVKWTAPEAVMYNRYTTKSDVWSYGMVMYEIWSLGHKPFEDFSVEEVCMVILCSVCTPLRVVQPIAALSMLIHSQGVSLSNLPCCTKCISLAC